jgi:hypothetical protein
MRGLIVGVRIANSTLGFIFIDGSDCVFELKMRFAIFFLDKTKKTAF